MAKIRAFVIDKGFNILIGGPLACAVMTFYSQLWTFLSWQVIVSGIFVFLSVWFMIQFLKSEFRLTRQSIGAESTLAPKLDFRKAALLEWREANDPEFNLSLPSSRRTSAVRPAEAKTTYLAARELAIKSDLKPPAPTGDDGYDSLLFWQWCREP